VSDRTGLSRGDRNRNCRLARLRVLLPPRYTCETSFASYQQPTALWRLTY
jgi:hypothetical protein